MCVFLSFFFQFFIFFRFFGAKLTPGRAGGRRRSLALALALAWPWPWPWPRPSPGPREPHGAPTSKNELPWRPPQRRQPPSIENSPAHPIIFSSTSTLTSFLTTGIFAPSPKLGGPPTPRRPTPSLCSLQLHLGVLHWALVLAPSRPWLGPRGLGGALQEYHTQARGLPKPRGCVTWSQRAGQQPAASSMPCGLSRWCSRNLFNSAFGCQKIDPTIKVFFDDASWNRFWGRFWWIFGYQNRTKLVPKWYQKSMLTLKVENQPNASRLAFRWLSGVEVGSQNRSKIDLKMESKMECILASISPRFRWNCGAKLGGKINQKSIQKASKKRCKKEG